MRSGSPCRYCGTLVSICQLKSSCFSLAVFINIASSVCNILIKSNSRCSIVILPASIFAMSSISFTRLSRLLLEFSMMSENFCCSLFNVVCCSSPLKPLMAFNGVRISWLIFARNWSLISADFFTSSFAFSSAFIRLNWRRWRFTIMVAKIKIAAIAMSANILLRVDNFCEASVLLLNVFFSLASSPFSIFIAVW